MTSYQKRKAELRQAREKARRGAELAREIKHYFLALARGQEQHAETVKKGVLRRAMNLWQFCDSEKKELSIFNIGQQKAIKRAIEIAKDGSTEQKENFVANCRFAIDWLTQHGNKEGAKAVKAQYRAYLKALTKR